MGRRRGSGGTRIENGLNRPDMTFMDDVVLVEPVRLDAEIERLAKRYAAAGGLGIDVLNALGLQADSLTQRLPDPVQARLREVTTDALTQALNLAHKSRGVVPDQADWLNKAMSIALGASGGLGGLPTALAEIPVTTMLLLRVIEGVAAENGFDPGEENVRFDCLQVFCSAGPLAEDDGSDFAFLSARMALSGTAVQAIIARVAPRLAAVMGQKLAAQAVPVLGAAAGGAVNYAYTRYYTEMAHVHFTLRRLAIDADQDHDELVEHLRAALPRVKLNKS
jgi:hypothetical protein